MRFRNRFAIGVATIVAAVCATGGIAAAFTPNFSDCPSRGQPSGSVCIDIQSQSGEVIIKGFRVPLDHSLEIRGLVREPDALFIPPAGSNGFIAQPVNVPGGLLGIELPLGFTQVLATAELAGPSSAIRIAPGDQTISMPIKLRLSNFFLGSGCHIGSDRSPVMVNLIPGTTSPPPPNRPITGHPGTLSFVPPDVLLALGGLSVDNSFAIPGATGCGGLFEVNNLLVNAKLKLPSAAGNNTISIANDVGLRILP